MKHVAFVGAVRDAIVCVCLALAGACSGPSGQSDASDGAATDGASDTATDAAACSTDGGIPSFQMVSVTNLAEQCAADAQTDTFQFVGSITISNQGAATIGPVTITQGFVALNNQQIAQFAISPTTIQAIAPGATGSAAVMKIDGSLVPADACGVIPCGMPLRIQLAASGCGIDPSRPISSELVVVNCSM